MAIARNQSSSITVTPLFSSVQLFCTAVCHLQKLVIMLHSQVNSISAKSVDRPGDSVYQCTRRLLDNSRICQLADCQLADWTTRGLDISRTGQVAD